MGVTPGWLRPQASGLRYHVAPSLPLLDNFTRASTREILYFCQEDVHSWEIPSVRPNFVYKIAEGSAVAPHQNVFYTQ